MGGPTGGPLKPGFGLSGDVPGRQPVRGRNSELDVEGLKSFLLANDARIVLRQLRQETRGQETRGQETRGQTGRTPMIPLDLGIRMPNPGYRDGRTHGWPSQTRFWLEWG